MAGCSGAADAGTDFVDAEGFACGDAGASAGEGSGERPVAAELPPMPSPMADIAAQNIAFGKRADADMQAVAIVPKSVRGYKLPPSSLLYKSEEHAQVRENELREEARVLVEKCGEFGVDGSVEQINPGPVVTTFEFRPDAGVKYSRVTGLADDLCLAMAAESILIERMPGKSTVGIQVPNHEREMFRVELRPVCHRDARNTPAWSGHTCERSCCPILPDAPSATDQVIGDPDVAAHHYPGST